MPRYLVERSYPGGLEIPPGDAGTQIRQGVIEANAGEGVHWSHSYVTADKQSSVCVYDAPNPEAIRKAATAAGLPVDRIVEVNLLDPHPYH